MNNDNKFPEQEAPAKNTDDAFVQVSEKWLTSYAAI